MRPRFLFLSARPSGSSEAIAGRLSTILPRKLDIGGDRLFTAPDCPVIEMPAIGGCIVGAVFTADGSAPRGAFARAEQLAIMSSEGGSLLKGASGAYVAVWRGYGAAPLIALRDPSACLPAYAVAGQDVIAIASDVECLVVAGLTRVEIDIEGLAACLRFPQVPSERTCLNGIRDLLPGYRTQFGATGVISRAIWRPRDFVSQADAPAERIVHVVEQVVAGQRGETAHVAIELSGGLDSSIVAAGLSSSRGATAINMVPAAQDGDERRYARLVAEHLGMAMREVALGPEHIDILTRPTRLTPRPTGVDHLTPLDQLLRTAQREAGAAIVFSGAGGDSVFCYLASTAPVVDAWLDGGWARARSTLADIATITNLSQWEVARHLLLRLSRRRGKDRGWPAADLLLGPAGRAAPSPDASQLDGLRPGARAHAASILRSQTLTDSYGRMAEGAMRYPLLAQPVLELCLSIPSWRWMKGGRNRALAREAYRGRLPEAILQRTGKGRLDTLIIGAYEQVRADIAPLLRDGWLATHGIIDLPAVEAALATPVTGSSMMHSRIQILLDAELWCQMIVSRQSETGT